MWPFLFFSNYGYAAISCFAKQSISWCSAFFCLVPGKFVWLWRPNQFPFLLFYYSIFLFQSFSETIRFLWQNWMMFGGLLDISSLFLKWTLGHRRTNILLLDRFGFIIKYAEHGYVCVFRVYECVSFPLFVNIYTSYYNRPLFRCHVTVKMEKSSFSYIRDIGHHSIIPNHSRRKM